MPLQHLFAKALIVPALPATNRWEAIEVLVTRVASHLALGEADRVSLLTAVNERERSLGTGLEKGIAIPHAFSPRLEGTVLALGLANEGISFDAMDGVPARIIALLVAPSTEEARKAHVQLLALLSHFFMDRQTRESLLEAGSTEEVRAVIARFLHPAENE